MRQALPQLKPASGGTGVPAAVEAAGRPNLRKRVGTAAAAVVTGPPAVVLKIRRRKFNQQQFHTGEIVVTRRLFRSGDSEYLLNGKLCRLRDIQELFMGTGLGPESYALIEQGRIGQILSSRPTDRRAIIEEAAGITKFKTKKRLAEARLEDAKLNLNRVNDIFEEVTRQMNSLKRQASKAERYAKLRDEMRAKLRVVLASKFTQLDVESAEIDAQLNHAREEMQQRTEAVQQLEAENGERTQRGYAIDGELRQNRDRLNQIALEIDRGQARRRTNEERCAELMARSASSDAELAQAAIAWPSLEEELASNQQILESGGCRSCRRATANSRSASRRRLQRAPTCATLEREIEQGRASRSWKRWPRPPSCAISSRRPRSVWLRSIAKPSGCRTKSRRQIRRSRPSADSADNSHWSLKPSRNA